MKNVLKPLLATVFGGVLSSNVHAAPMDSNDVDIAYRFSTFVQKEFVLLADSYDPKVVYYIPKQGGIALDANLSSKPFPRFQIFEYTPSFGIFAGEYLTRFGGSFDTTGHLGVLDQLQKETREQARDYASTSLPLQSAFCLDLLEKSGCPLRKSLLVECLSIHPDRSEQLASHLNLLSRRGLIEFE